MWTGARSSAGYGVTTLDGRLRYAHGVAYEMAHLLEEMPAGLRHTCGNRLCTNPAHLEATSFPVQEAEKDSLVRLPDIAVVAIYLDDRKQKDIAADYCCKPLIVRRIKHRKYWRHLPLEGIDNERE